jgi:hypothetical protein
MGAQGTNRDDHDHLRHRNLLVAAEVFSRVAEVRVLSARVVIVHINEETDAETRYSDIGQLDQPHEVHSDIASPTGLGNLIHCCVILQ